MRIFRLLQRLKGLTSLFMTVAQVAVSQQQPFLNSSHSLRFKH